MTTKMMNRGRIDFAAINAACLTAFPALLATWLPDGRRTGDEWIARNPHRADRRAGSFKINMRTGLWSDFATGDRGGDPVSLYAFLSGLRQSDAAHELQNEWGLGDGGMNLNLTELTHPKAGRPAAQYVYRADNGNAVLIANRFENRDSSKFFLPFDVASQAWEAPDARPLYNLDKLTANDNRPVILVEGEKCADALTAARTTSDYHVRRSLRCP